jgi:hypothetical protein
MLLNYKFESFIEENSAHVFPCKPQYTHEKPNFIPFHRAFKCSSPLAICVKHSKFINFPYRKK